MIFRCLQLALQGPSRFTSLERRFVSSSNYSSLRRRLYLVQASTCYISQRRSISNMPVATRSSDSQQEIDQGGHQDNPKHIGQRLVVCFDGTGNVFTGTPAGIGTYPAEGPVNVNFFRSIARKFEAVLDQALATSFDAHVIAGYNFIMRYYSPGDRIYIFGFSRGAFTARFVARMISHVGLLSKGNEEMVPFAYKVYQDYEANRGGTDAKQAARVKYMNSFKSHFCRTERDIAKASGEDISDNESGIKVDFLGLFDCVSSVGNLDVPFFQKAPPLPAVTGTAKHIRHAVAIDERRVKFKAALFQQEEQGPGEDIKEVWFPGNHGDVGGGWDVPAKESGEARENTDNDYFQLSDIALKWMVDELDHVEKKHDDPENRIAWDTVSKASFLTRFDTHRDDMIEKAQMHDTMTFGGGSSWIMALLWKWMDTIPIFIKRWEFVLKPRTKDEWHWDYIGFPPNLGNRRDIPSRALFHNSVLQRMRTGKDVNNRNYLPSNLLWVTTRSDSEKLEKRNLKELGTQYAPKANNTNGTSTTIDGITFIHDVKATSFSVPVEGLHEELSKQLKSDRVYRVQKTTAT